MTHVVIRAMRISMTSGNGSGSMKVGRLSLGLKFSLAVTVLIVLTMTGVAALVISFQKNALRESNAQNALAMTRNLAHDAAGPLLVFDPLRLVEMVRTVQVDTSSAYAMVTDRGGMVVAHTRRSQLGGKADSWPATPGPDSETVREIATEAGTVREYTIPVHIGSEVLGAASVAYSVRTVDATIERDVAKLREISLDPRSLIADGAARRVISGDTTAREAMRVLGQRFWTDLSI